MTTIYKYRIKCTTDDVYEYGWYESTPTTCPTNTAHTIDTAQTAIVDVRDQNIVEIKEESTPTGGYFSSRSLKIDAIKNTITSRTICFPMPISALTVCFISTSEHEGDEISMGVGLNTIVGELTANVTAKPAWISQNYVVDDEVLYENQIYKCILDTVSNEVPTNTTYWQFQELVLNVSPTVVQNVKLGFYINLFDGVNSDTVGCVAAIDTVNNTINVHQGSTNSFSAASPTYVRMCVYNIKDRIIGPPGEQNIGTSKIGGSYVPAYTDITVCYDNKSLTDDKTFIGHVEYLY
jgi:hypothetical protein